MKHTVTWVATLNGADSRIYSWERLHQRLHAIDLGITPGVHKPTFPDRPVRTYSSASTARGFGDPKTDAERALEEDYIERVIKALNTHYQQGQFHHLIIAAPARALGAFRALAPGSLAKAIHTEIPHDYVKTPPDTLLERLSEHVIP